MSVVEQLIVNRAWIAVHRIALKCTSDQAMQVEVLALNMLPVLPLAYTLQGMSLPHAKTCAFTSKLYVWLGSQHTSAYQLETAKTAKSSLQLWCHMCASAHTRYYAISTVSQFAGNMCSKVVCCYMQAQLLQNYAGPSAWCRSSHSA